MKKSQAAIEGKPINDDNGRSGQKKHSAVKPLLVRVPVKFMAALKEEAVQNETSVNSLIVSVLKKHAAWGRFQERLGFMPMHKSMIAMMLDKISPQDAEEIGRLQKDQTIRDFLLLKSGYSLETFVQWMELRCEVLGFLFMRRQEKDSLFVMIRHDMGQNWSFYYRGMFSAVLRELLPKENYGRAAFSTSSSSFSVSLGGIMMVAEDAV